MGPFSENLAGKIANIRLDDGTVHYHIAVAFVIMDLNGLPLAVKAENGSLFNWKHITAVLVIP